MAPSAVMSSPAPAGHPRLHRRVSRTTVDMLAEACDNGCDKRRASLRILLGMLYSHGVQIVALRPTLQEGILRRCVAQLVSRPDMPIPMLMVLYTGFGEWRLLAHASRREKKLFQGFDKHLGKKHLEHAFVAWAEYFESTEIKKQSANKMVVVLSGASGKQLLQFVNEGWKKLVDTGKAKIIQQRKLMSVISNSSNDVVIRNSFYGWQMDIQHKKTQDEKLKMKQRQMGKAMSVLDKGNKGLLLINTFRHWHDLVETQKTEDLRAQRELERLQQQMAMNRMQETQRMQSIKMLLNSQSGFLKHDTFGLWNQAVKTLKEKLAQASQLLAVMSMGQDSLIMNTCFHEWHKVLERVANSKTKLRTMMVAFVNEAQAALEASFKDWAHSYKESKQKMVASKKFLWSMTSGQDQALLSGAFGSWRDEASKERRAREASATRETQQQAVLKSMQMMCQEQEGMLVATTLHSWSSQAAKEKLEKAKRAQESQYIGRSLQLISQGDSQLLLVNAFRSWHVVMIREQGERRDAAADLARQEHERAEKVKKQKVMQTIFNNNTELLVVGVFAAWIHEYQDVCAKKKKSEKMVRWMASEDSNMHLSVCLKAWVTVTKDNKYSCRSKDSAKRMVGLVAEGNDKMELAKTWAAWHKMVDMKKDKLEVNKKMVARLAMNDAGTMTLVFFAEWQKALDVCRQERRRGVQREKNRHAAGSLVNSMMCASMGGALNAWVQFIKDVKAKRKHDKKSETMGLLAGSGDGPLLLTRVFNAWLEVVHDGHHDAELQRMMAKNEAADNQKTWVGNRILQDAQTTAFMGIFLHWAYAAKATKNEKLAKKLAFRNQQLPLMTHDLLDRLTARDTVATLLRWFNAWRRLTACPKTASRNMVAKTHAAMSLAASSAPLRTMIAVWGELTRTKKHKTAEAARFGRAAKSGVVRWLAADSVMTLTGSFQSWQHAATAGRRQREAERQAALAVEASEASRWRAEAQRHASKRERAWRCAEGAVTTLVARAQQRRALADYLSAWRSAHLDERAQAVRAREQGQRAKREARHGRVTAMIQDSMGRRGLRRAWDCWLQVHQDSRMRGSLRCVGLYVFGGFGPHSPAEAERLNIGTGLWEVLPRMPQPRCGAGATCLGHVLYVAGGFFGRQHLDTADCFDPRTGSGKWGTLPEMGDRRGYVAVVSMHDCIYAIGGFNGSTRLSSVERFSPSVAAWSRVPPMHVKRQCAAAAALDNQLYVTGGDDGSGSLDSVERFDPYESRWEMLPPMQVRRSGAAAVAAHGCLYVLGGSDGEPLCSCEQFDPASRMWSELPPMRVRRDAPGAANVEGLVYVFGGHDGALRQRSMECFRVQPMRWEDCPTPPQARNFAAVAAGPC